MAQQSRVLTESGWGRTESAIMIAAFVGFLTPWVLFVIAPPDDIVWSYGIAISLIAGAVLSYGVYSYLRY